MTAPRPRHARPDVAAVSAVPPVDDEKGAANAAPAPPLARCNVRGCDDHPEWRGLCSAHRQTHRGLADEKDTP